MAASSQQSPGDRQNMCHGVTSSALHFTPPLGKTGVPRVGGVPLDFQKRPRNLGKPASALLARASLGLPEGVAGTAAGRSPGGPAWSKHDLPRAPWQMSVRVAPSTMNCGFESSSCKTSRRAQF